MTSLHALRLTDDSDPRESFKTFLLEWAGYRATEDPSVARALGNPTLRELFQAASYAAGLIARVGLVLAGVDRTVDGFVDEHGRALCHRLSSYCTARPYEDTGSDLALSFAVRKQDAQLVVRKIRDELLPAVIVVVPGDCEGEPWLDEPTTGR